MKYLNWVGSSTDLGLLAALRELLSLRRTYAMAAFVSVLAVDTRPSCGGFPHCLAVRQTWPLNVEVAVAMMVFMWYLVWVFAEQRSQK